MGIEIKHPLNTIDIYNKDLTIRVKTPSGESHKINLNSSCITIPVRDLPKGVAGALVVDNKDKVMKYFDGSTWISWSESKDLSKGIDVDINEIKKILNTKVDKVTYSVKNPPNASITGTTLNIVFPSAQSIPKASTGLYSSMPSGSISYYAKTNGSNMTTIRNELGNQTGKNGTINAPFETKTGWALADGNYWKSSISGLVSRVPNLNRKSYLKSISVNNIVKIDNVVKGFGVIKGTALKVEQLPNMTFKFVGNTSTNGEHIHYMDIDQNIQLGTSNNEVQSYTDINISKSGQSSTQISGKHNHKIKGTSNTIGGNQTHTHNLNNIDVSHFYVAILYNIDEPVPIMNKEIAEKEFVKKTGDTISGQLTVTDNITVKGSNPVLNFDDKFHINYNTSTKDIEFKFNGSSTFVKYKENNTLELNAINVSKSFVINGNKEPITSLNGVEPDVNGDISISFLPVGTPIPYPLKTPPTGWLKCNGQTFDKAKYPELAKVYTSGKLPDLRGEFIRGWSDDRSGIDDGRTLLSVQEDRMQPHIHQDTFGFGNRDVSGYSSFGERTARQPNSVGGAGGRMGNYRYMSWSYKLPFTNDGSDFDKFSNKGRVGHEVRPVNIAMLYIVRGE